MGKIGGSITADCIQKNILQYISLLAKFEIYDNIIKN